ncbi:hypothetical protein DH2020_019593 [Rehmannia glutinosa]|uniref:Glycosyltransferase family 28 N-terminal domain-containing protein n=1 Tax=Rehmannia glutinosa TaxID=99300 RepID=A0ABR0WPZ0_REHGL
MAAVVCSSLTPPNTRLRSHLSSSKRIAAVSYTTTTATAPSTTCTDNLRVVFAAGGTGGHIYPALAIADELKILNPKTQFLFVGTPTGMEATTVPSACYPFTAVPTAPLSRPLISLKNLFVFPFVVTKAIFESYKILKEFDPDIVVGTGGFVSFPTCLAAAIKGVKLLIQEQNSVPGIANLVLSLFADKVCVAFNSSVECFWQRNKCAVCGNPVRLSLMKQTSKTVGRWHFFPKVEVKGEGKVVLVLGGSLGANMINNVLLNAYYQMLNENDDLFIIWQTGMAAFHEMERRVRNHPRLLLSP